MWASASGAAPPPDLPAITPQELVASVIATSADPGPLSGDVEAKLELGLPQLPDTAYAPPGSEGDPLLLLAWLAGDHRVRVWRSADGLRVADLLPNGERALVVGEGGAWGWDSTTFTAYELGPPDADSEALRAAGWMTGLGDPSELARRSLAILDPTTEVVLGQNLHVAGRGAYLLRARPRNPDTLVGTIEIAVDADRRIPLRVEVFARGSASPSISVGYTRVSFAPVDPSVYAFRPPDGATVERFLAAPHTGDRLRDRADAGLPPTGRIASAPRVFGSDWATVVAVPLPSGAESSSLGSLASLLPYSGPLLSARLVTTGGRTWILAGAVPQSVLAAVEPRLS